MGRRNMDSKLCLILSGLVVAIAVLASAENNEDSSLSEELASSRVARFAEADAGKKKRKALRKRKRKQRKNKKAKKGLKKRKNKKKNRKNRKNRNKNRKNNKGTRKSTRTIDGVCLESAVTAMRRWKDVVTNFEKQKKRIDKQSEIAGKKSGKQSVFGPIALKLTNLTSTLFDCEVAVNASCTTDFPMPNMTFVDECVNASATFVAAAEACLTLSKEATAADACTCWAAPELATASEAVKDCRIPEVAAVAQGLKACKDAFSTCRKFEDEAVTSMAACSVS